MPELVLKFNLPEEQNEADVAFSAHKLFNVIWEFKQELRTKLKHGDYKGKEYALLEALSNKLHDDIESNEVAHLF